MPNPVFGIVAAARLDITAGASSRAAYYALVTQYQFGTPIIYGRAPAELATSLGVPLYSSVVDLGIASTVPGVVVVSFPYATPSVVVGGIAYPVSTAVTGGTLAGVNYVDGNGVLHPDVDWQWQISVEPYTSTTIGRWDQAIVTWVGDGTANRLIPTTFDLSFAVCNAAVWIFPSTAGSPEFRFNDPLMTGTAMKTSPVTTASGIMSFEAGGFRVTDFLPNNVKVNVLGENYTAIVVRDTTPDRRFIRLGVYHGIGAINTVNTFTAFSNIVVGTMTTFDIGRSLTIGGIGGYTVSGVIDGTHYTIAGDLSIIGGPMTVLSAASDRTFNTGGQPITQMWIFGRASQCVFDTDQFPVNTSTSFGNEAKSLTNQLTSVAGSNFTVGTDNNVNDSTLYYYYVAFSIPVGSAIRNTFATYVASGSAGGVVVPLPFTPGFATARPYTINVPASVWRSPWETTNRSKQFDETLVTTGITALGAASLTLGAGTAPAGMDVYGFALAAAGSAAVVTFAAATVTAAAPLGPPAGGILPITAGSVGGSSAGGQACHLGTAITPAV